MFFNPLNIRFPRTNDLTEEEHCLIMNEDRTHSDDGFPIDAPGPVERMFHENALTLEQQRELYACKPPARPASDFEVTQQTGRAISLIVSFWKYIGVKNANYWQDPITPARREEYNAYKAGVRFALGLNDTPEDDIVMPMDMPYLRERQTQQLEWQTANFGVQGGDNMLLGMIEELGELAGAHIVSGDAEYSLKNLAILLAYHAGKICHAILKEDQNIRGNEDHTLTITTSSNTVRALLNMVGSDYFIGESTFRDMLNEMPNYDGSDVKDAVGDLVVYTLGYCNAPDVQLDMHEAVDETCDKVFKRDWNKDPHKGGE